MEERISLHGWGSYLIRRILIIFPLLVGVSIVLFTLISLMPGDALDLMVSPDLGREQLELRRERLGLDQPIYIRYIRWMGELVQGNLGFSTTTRRPVAEMIGARLGPTLLLMGTALVVSLVIGVLLGTVSALKQRSLTDHVATLGAFAGVCIPNFFLALVCIYLFSVILGWLPSSGMRTPGMPFSLLDRVSRLIMPLFVLSLQSIAIFTRYMRSSMLEVIHADYVRTARAKGLAERSVVYKHALRNALMPIVTVLGLRVRWLFGGSVIIERVFSWPGIGRLMVDSVFTRDTGVIMGIVMISALLVMVGNLLADVAYAIVDPRIRFS